MKRKALSTVACLIGFPALLWGGTKEELIRLQKDVLQLQQKIEMLQKIVDDRNAVIISLLEQLNDQTAKGNLTMNGVVEAIRGQTDGLQGSIDEVKGELQGLSLKLDDTNNRVAALHRKMDDNQMRVQSLREVEPGPGGEVQPDTAFFQARTDYQMGNYELAVARLQDFLAAFPDNELGDNAASLLGDCYLKQGRIELAVQAFDQVINLYPDGDKTPVAYFKKAKAYESLQRMDEAIATFRRLAELFPDSQEARLALQELEHLGVRISGDAGLG